MTTALIVAAWCLSGEALLLREVWRNDGRITVEDVVFSLIISPVGIPFVVLAAVLGTYGEKVIIRRKPK